MNTNSTVETVGAALDEAARAVGGRDELARQLTGLGHRATPAAIGNWRTRGVPIKAAVKIARLVPTVTRERLRPDDFGEIWPDLSQAAAIGGQTSCG